MNHKTILLALVLISLLGLVAVLFKPTSIEPLSISLPSPVLTGKLSVEQAITRRRSQRLFKNQKLSLQDLSQLLWAGQGISSPKGFRTTPSAGGKYPLELFVISKRIDGLPPGIYHYLPKAHQLQRISKKVPQETLYQQSFHQSWVKSAPLIILVSADFKRTEEKYHELAPSFVWMEAGHCAQNIMLQATSLNLNIVGVGGFKRQKVDEQLPISPYQSLYLICIGKPL